MNVILLLYMVSSMNINAFMYNRLKRSYIRSAVFERIEGESVASSSPFPKLPSYNFLTLASSQLELLSHSLTMEKEMLNGSPSKSKVRSSVLYLPQENTMTGALEFVPTVIHPNPLKERIFIANDAESGLPPEIPKIVSKLLGFVHAESVLPTYPFATNSYGSSIAGVGDVDEVDGCILSCALFSGSRTVGGMSQLCAKE